MRPQELILFLLPVAVLAQNNTIVSTPLTTAVAVPTPPYGNGTNSSAIATGRYTNTTGGLSTQTSTVVVGPTSTDADGGLASASASTTAPNVAAVQTGNSVAAFALALGVLLVGQMI